MRVPFCQGGYPVDTSGCTTVRIVNQGCAQRGQVLTRDVHNVENSTHPGPIAERKASVLTRLFGVDHGVNAARTLITRYTHCPVLLITPAQGPCLSLMLIFLIPGTYKHTSGIIFPECENLPMGGRENHPQNKPQP